MTSLSEELKDGLREAVGFANVKNKKYFVSEKGKEFKK